MQRKRDFTINLTLKTLVTRFYLLSWNIFPSLIWTVLTTKRLLILWGIHSSVWYGWSLVEKNLHFESKNFLSFIWHLTEAKTRQWHSFYDAVKPVHGRVHYRWCVKFLPLYITNLCQSSFNSFYNAIIKINLFLDLHGCFVLCCIF